MDDRPALVTRRETKVVPVDTACPPLTGEDK